MKNCAAPLWLQVQERIDYVLFVLEQIEKEVNSRTPVSALVDKATGYDKKLLSTIEYWGRYLKRLKKLHDKLTKGHHKHA